MMDIHNHSVWSDGADTPVQIIQNAIAHDIRTVGICDHYGSRSVKSICREDLPDYIQTLHELNRRYEGQCTVLAGLEIPAGCVTDGFDRMLSSLLERLHFILIEDMEYRTDGKNFTDSLRHLDRLSCAKGLAHCDLHRLSACSGKGMDAIAADMKASNVFWEINASLQHPYFDDILEYTPQKSPVVDGLFELLNRHGIEIAVGSDNHCTEDTPYGRLAQANWVMNRHLIARKW